MPWMYIRHGRCVHRNRCLRMKAAFARRDNSPANAAFAARAAITVVLVMVVAGEDPVLVATALVMVVDPVDGFSVSIERAFP